MTQLAAVHPAVRFLAVSDADPARAGSLAEKTVAQVASRYNLEAISRPEVDALIVSTIKRAVASGKPMKLAPAKAGPKRHLT